MNIFSESYFLNAFGQAYFPNQKITQEVSELEGQLWRLPFINSSKAITGSTFIDFFEPLGAELVAPENSLKKACYLSRVSHGMVQCSEWFEQNLGQLFEASPTSLWGNFESWDAFQDHVRKKRSHLFSDSQRKQRKLEKELGPLQFVFDDRRPEVLKTCFRWKSEQWRNNGLPDRFANPNHLHFFLELAANQTLLVSSLSAQENLLAVHVGLLDKGRFYWWVPAYDANYSRYSPGRLLLHFLLQESFNQHHTEFDFLRGDEDYKWYYATHVRLIKDIGQRPVLKQFEHFLKSTLGSSSGVTIALKKLRNKAISLGYAFKSLHPKNQLNSLD